MKKEFSKKWKGSRQARKQRKYLAKAPLHLKHKKLSSNLSKDLRKKYGRRNLTIRKGDEVKILNGNFRGKTGKIAVVNVKKGKIAVENIQRKKKDGTKIYVLLDPSNIQIQSLVLDDKKRLESLSRKTNLNKSNNKK